MKIFRADQLKTVVANTEFVSLREGNELNFPKFPTQIRTFQTQKPMKGHLFLNYFGENSFFKDLS